MKNTDDSMRHSVTFRHDDIIQRLLRDIMLKYKDRFETESQVVRAAIINFHRELMEVKDGENSGSS